MEFAQKTLAEKKAKLEQFRPKLAEGEVKVNKVVKFSWTAINCLFVIGGMIGTFSSKFLMDKLGRKTGILIHHMFSIVASILILLSAFFHYPTPLIFARFLFGIQGGMSCTFIPTYLSEIAPHDLRGRTGIVHQLCITIGIVVAQLFGLRQILGRIYFKTFRLHSSQVLI